MDKSQNQLDKLLSQSLKEHLEPVPDDFTAKILSKLKKTDEQKILAKIIFQQRLALTGCLILCTVPFIIIAAFPGSLLSLANNILAFGDKIVQITETAGHQWQLYLASILVIAFAFYSLMDFLVGDS